MSAKLCLSCGMCCNGVIFRDVKLQKDDDAGKLKNLGLPISRRILPQPCAALEGCRCRVYADRPTYCRQFECALFKNVMWGNLKATDALAIIRDARRKVKKVLRLLRGLGDPDESKALGVRFREMSRRMERPAIDENTAENYGQLTLAMHDLNVLLSESFYPGSEEVVTAKTLAGRIAEPSKKR